MSEPERITDSGPTSFVSGSQARTGFVLSPRWSVVYRGLARRSVGHLHEIHGFSESLVDFVDDVIQDELDVSPKSEPGHCLRMIGNEVEVFLRIELDAHGVGAWMLLHC